SLRSKGHETSSIAMPASAAKGLSLRHDSASLPYMKLSWIVAVAGLLTCFAASRADAQQQAEYTPSYLALIEEAEREFRRDNLDAALAVLKRADAVMKDTAVALNMRGAIATQQQ